MTEAEALSELRSFPVNCLDFREQMALDMSIEALEEVQRYRAIGTVEGFERAIQSSIENYNLYREYKAKAQEVAKEYGKKLNRCDTCTHYVADEVPPICYFCCKGMEDNYQQKGE